MCAAPKVRFEILLFDEWGIRMDFHEALVAQIRSKRRWPSCVPRPDPGLCLNLFTSAEQCELGQWLAGAGSKFAGLPEFAGLVASHARFHHAASAIMGSALSQDIDPDAQSDFMQASDEIVKALIAMLKRMLVAQ